MRGCSRHTYICAAAACDDRVGPQHVDAVAGKPRDVDVDDLDPARANRQPIRAQGARGVARRAGEQALDGVDAVVCR